MKVKKCFKCEQDLPLNKFYTHPQMKDGHLNKCIACTKHDVREHRKANIDKVRLYDQQRQQTPERREKKKQYAAKWRAGNADKRAAHVILNNAMRYKGIKRGVCVICGGDESVQGHHEDYSKPLDVVWLCCQHHHDLHNGKIEI